MLEGSRPIDRLDWPSLVSEARRRRKAEGLTQRNHAALAGVSVPTIAAFDQGLHTLTLAKVFDILRVVGLIETEQAHGTQDAFVSESFERWHKLTSSLPSEAAARFLHGWYSIDYCLEGDVRLFELADFKKVLRCAVQHHTGWPAFFFSNRPEFAPREAGSAIECWLGEAGVERTFNEPARLDFWRASPSGRLFLLRGYEEDSQETFPPASIFDTALPIWRLGEVMLHAERLARLMRKNDRSEVIVRFRVTYTALRGRILRSWANPLSDLWLEGHPSHGDEAILETSIEAEGITERLGAILLPMVASLYERFGVSGLNETRVKAETSRLLNTGLRERK